MASKPRTVLAALAGWLAVGVTASAQTVVPPPKDEAICGDTGKVRTVTFILPAARFPGRGYTGSDLQIQATKGDAVIRLVRVIKLP